MDESNSVNKDESSGSKSKVDSRKAGQNNTKDTYQTHDKVNSKHSYDNFQNTKVNTPHGDDNANAKSSEHRSGRQNTQKTNTKVGVKKTQAPQHMDDLRPSALDEPVSITRDNVPQRLKLASSRVPLKDDKESSTKAPTVKRSRPTPKHQSQNKHFQTGKPPEKLPAYATGPNKGSVSTTTNYRAVNKTKSKNVNTPSGQNLKESYRASVKEKPKPNSSPKEEITIPLERTSVQDESPSKIKDAQITEEKANISENQLKTKSGRTDDNKSVEPIPTERPDGESQNINEQTPDGAKSETVNDPSQENKSPSVSQDDKVDSADLLNQKNTEPNPDNGESETVENPTNENKSPPVSQDNTTQSSADLNNTNKPEQKDEGILQETPVKADQEKTDSGTEDNSNLHEESTKTNDTSVGLHPSGDNLASEVTDIADLYREEPLSVNEMPHELNTNPTIDRISFEEQVPESTSKEAETSKADDVFITALNLPDDGDDDDNDEPSNDNQSQRQQKTEVDHSISARQNKIFKLTPREETYLPEAEGWSTFRLMDSKGGIISIIRAHPDVIPELRRGMDVDLSQGLKELGLPPVPSFGFSLSHNDDEEYFPVTLRWNHAFRKEMSPLDKPLYIAVPIAAVEYNEYLHDIIFIYSVNKGPWKYITGRTTQFEEFKDQPFFEVRYQETFSTLSYVLCARQKEDVITVPTDGDKVYTVICCVEPKARLVIPLKSIYRSSKVYLKLDVLDMNELDLGNIVPSHHSHTAVATSALYTVRCTSYPGKPFTLTIPRPGHSDFGSIKMGMRSTLEEVVSKKVFVATRYKKLGRYRVETAASGRLANEYVVQLNLRDTKCCSCFLLMTGKALPNSTTRIDKDEKGYMTTAFLKKLGVQLADQRVVRSLGRRLLNDSSTDHVIRIHPDKAEVNAHMVLRRWNNINRNTLEEIKFRKLQRTLLDIGMVDIADDVEESYEQYLTRQEDLLLEVVMKDLTNSPTITTNWKDLARYLGLHKNAISQIDAEFVTLREKCLQVLDVAWRKNPYLNHRNMISNVLLGLQSIGCSRIPGKIERVYMDRFRTEPMSARDDNYDDLSKSMTIDLSGGSDEETTSESHSSAGAQFESGQERSIYDDLNRVPGSRNPAEYVHNI